MSELSLHGGDPSVLRRINAAATLRALRGGGEPTLSELAREVGLSRPTTEGVLSELADRGLVTEVAPRSGRGLGRPARRYRFRADAGYALGLDIDAHHVRLFLADLDGEVVAGHHAAVALNASATERLAAVRVAVSELLATVGVERGALWAVAAGTPGVVSPEGRIALCTVVPDWEGVALARELGRMFPCPVLVDNDANLAALAERWRGAARDSDDMVCVLAGPHTGMGAIIGGRLHRGRWGAAGEVGLLPELGLRDTAAVLAEAAPSGTLPAEDSDGTAGPVERAAERVLAAAQRGDSAAAELVDRLAARMARGIAAMALALDPEMIVVGGRLVRPGDRLVEALRRAVPPLCLTPVRIEASTLGEDAVALGALRLALDLVDEELFRIDRPA
ncbi:ROK family transcriptional regulator [Actinomadura hibisca]|uniref:ROK family transcriptional regulator n=1 Tax=Actinomadura hibisca TaxID=68565 RepID=UPI000836CD40|nr:ROK family protein [Actinomadura hibisca]